MPQYPCVTLSSLGLSAVSFPSPHFPLFLTCCNCSCHCLALLLPAIVETFHFYAVALYVLLVPSLSSALCPSLSAMVPLAVAACSCLLLTVLLFCILGLSWAALLICISDADPKAKTADRGQKKKHEVGGWGWVPCGTVKQVQQQWQHLRQLLALSAHIVAAGLAQRWKIWKCLEFCAQPLRFVLCEMSTWIKRIPYIIQHNTYPAQKSFALNLFWLPLVCLCVTVFKYH